jgi:hypothetical protein
MVDAAFVLVEKAGLPNAKKVVKAAKAAGITLSPSENQTDGSLLFDLDGGASLIVTRMDFPDPDVRPQS